MREMKLPDIIPVVICFGLVFWLYTAVFHNWYVTWMAKESEYTHAFLVPFISLFIMWLRRKDLADARVEPSIMGLQYLIPSLLVFVVMTWAGATSPQGLFFPVLIWGLVLMLLGPHVAKIVKFPVAYLFFMCTLPGDILTKVTFRIQMISTTGATALLNLFGLQAEQSGQFISLPGITVEVAAPCSGFRMLISLFAFSVLFAYLKEGPLWGRLTLVAITLPLSIVLNSLRIMMVAVVGDYWGSEAMHSFHDYSGYMVLAMAFVILPLLARLLKCPNFNSTLV